MKILYEDNSLLVCYKEAGLPVQSRSVTQMDLESMLRAHLRQQDQGRQPYLGLVHRLDQPVEGLVVFAKTPKAAADLSAQVQDGRIRKEYLAVCVPEQAGAPGQSGTLLEDWLLKDPRTNSSKVVPAGTKQGKIARLEYRVEGDFLMKQVPGARQEQSAASDLPIWQAPGVPHDQPGRPGQAACADVIGQDAQAGPIGQEAQLRFRVLRIHLLTGRHHQIRVQLSHAGLPIAGDRKYAPQAPSLPGYRFPALCALHLTLQHPESGKQLQFSVEECSAVCRILEAQSSSALQL